MADIIMPESQPCQFDVAWRGKCGKLSTNGWCSEHESMMCVVCGKKAVKSCDHTSTFVCGAALCEECQHSPSGSGHVTAEIARRMYEEEREEERAKIASRTSPIQRMDTTLGVPLNLFEFLKGDKAGYSLQHVYILALEHGCMGFFPAIWKDPERMLVTADRDLIMEIWKSLPARRSKLITVTCYVNMELGVAYEDVEGTEKQEECRPLKLLSRDEYEELKPGDEYPFEWAPGLIGSDMSPEEFRKTIAKVARDHDIPLPR